MRLSTSMTMMTAIIAHYPAPVSVYQPPALPPSTPFILKLILIVYIVLLLLIYILMTLNSCKPAGTRHRYGYGYTQGPKMATHQDTRTRTTGYGFSRVRVWVQPKVPTMFTIRKDSRRLYFNLAQKKICVSADSNSRPLSDTISTRLTTELPAHCWLCKLRQQVPTTIT
jgi:hypothetical protein